MKNKRINFFQPALLGGAIALAVFGLTGSLSSVSAQGLSGFDRDNAKTMLSTAKEDLKKNYYDPELRGLDIETHFKDAEAKLNQATTRDQLVLIVAQAMLVMNDSHTFFVPPSRAAQVKYGWEMKMVGDRAFVSAVKPQSDAETTGLKIGDEILSVDGFRPTRDNMWKMYYRYYALTPARSIRLVIKSPGDAESRELNVPAKIVRTANVTDWGRLFVQYLRERKDVGEDRYVEFGKDLMIWQMSTFSAPEAHIDEMMGKARGFKSLIIDLRGNSGGYVKTMERLAGYFFDHDVNIFEEKFRKETKTSKAKTRGGDIFKGDLFVMIDSESASASEIFSRLIQLEKRGKVIGDRSSGAVMVSRYYDHQSGVGNVLYFGNNITVADAIMSDGKSLEKVGVVPDVVLIPEGADLAGKRDPALAQAAKLAGVSLDPEKAGSLFPKEWRE